MYFLFSTHQQIIIPQSLEKKQILSHTDLQAPYRSCGACTLHLWTKRQHLYKRRERYVYIVEVFNHFQ